MITETQHTKTEKQLVPQLRFAEFGGEWNKHVLGTIATFSKGKNISKADIVEDGQTECIRYGELYTEYEEVITDIKSKTNIPIEELVFSEENDVIIPASGETQIDIATAACVTKGNVALGGDLNIIKTEKDGIFLSYYLNSEKKFDIARLAQGNAVVHIYNSQLKSLKLNFPTLPEQQKIARFLTSVDTKLQQLTQKKELLQQYKKGVMQQLFNQQLRFKPVLSGVEGQTDGSDYPDWEEKKLGEVFKISAGGDVKKENISLEKTETFKYPIFANSEKKKGLYGYSNLFKIDVECVTMTGRGSLGVANARFEKFYPIVRLLVLIPKLKSSMIFFENLLNAIRIFNESTGVPQLTSPQLATYKITFPCYEEQQQIASYLSALDTKIETLTQQIENTQQFKKGLLQQLFV